MEAVTTSISGYYAYGLIDANTLRNSVDNLFPTFAKNLDADYISGFYHRYKGGHDLLLSVPNTIIEKGFVDGFKHFGHIILTDFPTKAGIPIPGFSASGLGQYLENVGISKGWLNINIMDGAVSFLAIGEGSSDLLNAVSNNLEMNAFTFFDTFVEGSLEIALGICTKNPFLLISGIENIFAGMISTYKSLSIYIDPIDFFGAGLYAALIGSGLSFILSSNNINEKLKNSLITGLRSGSLGMMFSIQSTFGFGLMGGYIAYMLGNKLAADSNKSINRAMIISKEQFELFFKEVSLSNSNFLDLWNNISVHNVIDNEFIYLNNDIEIIKLEQTYLNNDIQIIKSDLISLNNDIAIIKI